MADTCIRNIHSHFRCHRSDWPLIQFWKGTRAVQHIIIVTWTFLYAGSNLGAGGFIQNRKGWGTSALYLFIVRLASSQACHSSLTNQKILTSIFNIWFVT